MIQQQQMMQQQMMIPPPMMMQPILNEQNNNFGKEPERYNVIFKPIFDSLPIIIILAYEGMPIKELLDKYINSIKGKLKENEINKLKLFLNNNSLSFSHNLASSSFHPLIISRLNFPKPE